MATAVAFAQLLHSAIVQDIAIRDKLGHISIKGTAGDGKFTFVVFAAGIAPNTSNTTIDCTTGDLCNIGIIDAKKIALTLSESTVVNS